MKFSDCYTAQMIAAYQSWQETVTALASLPNDELLSEKAFQLRAARDAAHEDFCEAARVAKAEEERET